MFFFLVAFITWKLASKPVFRVIIRNLRLYTQWMEERTNGYHYMLLRQILR